MENNNNQRGGVGFIGVVLIILFFPIIIWFFSMVLFTGVLFMEMIEDFSIFVLILLVASFVYVAIKSAVKVMCAPKKTKVVTVDQVKSIIKAEVKTKVENQVEYVEKLEKLRKLKQQNN